MDKLIEILKSIRPDVDFTMEDALIDDEILSSFDIIAMVSEINVEYGIEIQVDDLLPGSLLDIGGVDDCQLHVVQPLVRRVIQQVKSLAGCALVVLVIRNHAAEEVRGEDLRGLEVLQGKLRFSGRACADQSDQAELRNFNPEFTHFL